MVERLPVKEMVPGSSPGAGAVVIDIELTLNRFGFGKDF